MKRVLNATASYLTWAQKVHQFLGLWVVTGVMQDTRGTYKVHGASSDSY